MTETGKIYCIADGGQSFTCAPNTTEDCTGKKDATKSNSTMYVFVGAGIVGSIVVGVLLVRYFMKRAT